MEHKLPIEPKNQEQENSQKTELLSYTERSLSLSTPFVLLFNILLLLHENFNLGHRGPLPSPNQSHATCGNDNGQDTSDMTFLVQVYLSPFVLRYILVTYLYRKHKLFFK